MGSYLTGDDLAPFAEIDTLKASAMIADAEALAVAAAPCLADPENLTAEQRAAVVAVLRSAILRWEDSGSGAYTQQTAGPFSVSTDNRQTRRSLFWPAEIEQLQDICTAVNGGTSGAFAIDAGPTTGVYHDDACALRFGATYCSCGAILSGAGPLWVSEP